MAIGYIWQKAGCRVSFVFASIFWWVYITEIEPGFPLPGRIYRLFYHLRNAPSSKIKHYLYHFSSLSNDTVLGGPQKTDVFIYIYIYIYCFCILFTFFKIISGAFLWRCWRIPSRSCRPWVLKRFSRCQWNSWSEIRMADYCLAGFEIAFFWKSGKWLKKIIGMHLAMTYQN